MRFRFCEVCGGNQAAFCSLDLFLCSLKKISLLFTGKGCIEDKMFCSVMYDHPVSLNYLSTCYSIKFKDTLISCDFLHT